MRRKPKKVTNFYKPKSTFLLGDLLRHIGIACSDSALSSLSVKGIQSFAKAQKGDITFLYIKESVVDAMHTKASVCFVSKGFLREELSVPVIEVPDARFVQAKIAQILYPNFRHFPCTVEGMQHIDPTTVVHPSAVLGSGVRIGAFSYIGPNVIIGDDVQIGCHVQVHGNVTLSHTVIGDYVTIHSGASIGQPGFGFVIHGGQFTDMPHLGGVTIEDHVRIGANTTIDRGVLEDTVIGAGTRIDNLVQIAHNVKLGKMCVVVSQTGIAGSTVIGDGSMFGGQVGIADHLRIGKGVRVAAQSGVARNLEDGVTVGGSPAVPIKDWHRQVFLLNKLIKKRES